MSTNQITPERIAELRDRVEKGGIANAWRRSEHLAVLDALESSRAEVQRLTEDRAIRACECSPEEACAHVRRAEAAEREVQRLTEEVGYIRGIMQGQLAELQHREEQDKAQRMQIEVLTRSLEEARRTGAGRVDILGANYPTFIAPNGFGAKQNDPDFTEFQKHIGSCGAGRVEVPDLPGHVWSSAHDADSRDQCISEVRDWYRDWIFSRLSSSPQPSADVVTVPRGEWSELRAFARISGYPEGYFSFEVPFDRDFTDWGTSIANRMKITREEVADWLDALRSSTNHDAQEEEPICQCGCHTTPGMMHFVACCGPGTGKRTPKAQDAGEG